MNKIIGVAGLGLIGGSLAKALKANTSHTVYGADQNQSVLSAAMEEKTIEQVLDETLLRQCDMVLVALYPKDTVAYVKANLANFKKGAVIIDCAGVKSAICAQLPELASKRGLYFIGGHPMAGIEKSGYHNSFAQMFDGASMILCKDPYTNVVALKAAEMLFLSMGFKRVTLTTAEEHDKIIAFTSQLAHIVSSAYIKSDTAKNQIGFSAGSYKDLTRVARLDENLWTDLFFANKEYLTAELKSLIKFLGEYLHTLEEGQEEEMKRLLAEGKKAKEAIG